MDVCSPAGKLRAHPRRANFGAILALLALLCAAPSLAAAGDDPAAGDQPKAEPNEERTGTRRVEIGAFVDVLFAYNVNHPVDHANFLPGLGTSAKRDREVGINLAQVDVVVTPEPVGLKASLGYGTAPEVVHAAEVRGVATHPDVWRNVLQASIQWQTKLGRGLLLETGVYPSHIGMEAFATKDNWNYTRSWLGELSPYYQTGLKLAYPLNDRWSAQLHLLNGWQVIADNNRGKSVSGQIAYSSSKLSFSFNGIVGPEQADNDDDIRALADVVATWMATSSFSLGVSVDVAREGRPAGEGVGWKGVGLYARIAPQKARTALAVRAEYYDDEDGAISGIAQTLRELTATLEHRPVERLILKLEGRYDRSSADAFAAENLGPDGSPLRKRSQFLLLLGAVATF